MIRRLALALLAALALGACSDEPGSPVVGTLERDRIALSAERAEPITAVVVREGEQVAEGELVLQLDQRRARAEHAQLAAQLRQAQRRLDELVRGPRQERIAAARARLEAARSVAEQAQREVERLRRLRRQGLSSEQAIDSAESRLETAVGERDAARAELDALLEGTTVEELDQARAAVAAARAALEGHDVTLERLSIESPRRARVEALPFGVGETPPAGATIAVLRATDEPPYARVYVPAALRERLTPGTQLTVEVAGRGRFEGRVRYIASEAAYTPYYALTERDAGRLSYLAEIDLANGDALPTGLPVQVIMPQTGG